MSIALSLHLLAAIIWVGGMFFAHMILRPTAVAQLEPPQRLPLWTGVFNRFFPWVWGAVITLPASGYWIIFGIYGGMGSTPVFVHIMNAIGLVMIALFALLYFGPYQHLRREVAAQNWPEAAKRLDWIRRIVTTNLILGLLTSVVAVAGKYSI